MILNIETSGSLCSVAITDGGAVLYTLEESEPMSHAVKLAPFVEKCLEQLRRREAKLDAVAVSLGPGSYTGLRIGLSMAKGLVFGLGVPLIGVETLKVLACKAMFSSAGVSADDLLVPMVDARRMEVYTAAYDFALEEVMPAQAMILDENSYSDLFATGRRCVFIGSGAEKAREVVRNPNALWIPDARPHAADMMALSDLSFRQGRFIDPAYSVPLYLKEYFFKTKQKSEK